MEDSFSNVTISRTKTNETVSSHLILLLNVRTIHILFLRTYLDNGYRFPHTLPVKARAP